MENKNDSTKIKYIPLWLVVKVILPCPLYLYGVVQVVHQDLHVLHWVLVYITFKYLRCVIPFATIDMVSNLTTKICKVVTQG